MPRPAVVLLTTGGTVSTEIDATTARSRPSLDAASLASLVRRRDIEVRAMEVARRASWELDPLDMLRIATAARDAAGDPTVSGVVVTHGTTTMEYTAFLTDLLLEGDRPVVFTGAMHRSDDPRPDGPGNLRDAIRVAAWPEASGLGCLVVFSGRIMAASSVWKARRAGTDAFVDLAGDVGAVSTRTIRMLRRPERLPAFTAVLAPEVVLVKAVPGAGGHLIDAALQAPVRGLVVEALPGAGGIPPGMRPALVAAARQVPVVIASRAPYGSLPPEPTGGTGEPLHGSRILSAGRFTAEQAFVLLMIILGAHADAEAAREAYKKAVATASSGSWPTAEDPARVPHGRSAEQDVEPA